MTTETITGREMKTYFCTIQVEMLVEVAVEAEDEEGAVREAELAGDDLAAQIAIDGADVIGVDVTDILEEASEETSEGDD